LRQSLLIFACDSAPQRDMLDGILRGGACGKRARSISAPALMPPMAAPLGGCAGEVL